MDRFLIEVPHDPAPLACARVVHVFLSTGSHYLAGADWGCADGNHTAWMIVDATSREEARQIVPALLRPEARVVRLTRYTLDDVERVLGEHGA